MELMEGGDLRKALWQNKEEYAWENRGGQVLLCILVTATVPEAWSQRVGSMGAEFPATAVSSSCLVRRWRWILLEVCTSCTRQA